MGTVRRVVTASLLSIPLTIGAAGIASADTEFEASGLSVDADHGVQMGQISADTDGNNWHHHDHDYNHGHFYNFDNDWHDVDTLYAANGSYAGPGGAGSGYVVSATNDDGDAVYAEGGQYAGPDGAATGNVFAASDG